MEGGKPLMQALKERQSNRSFSKKKLSPQMISNLLWAAFGINRPESGKRTAPSAMNKQQVELWVIMENGTFIYDAKENKLKRVLKKDVRELTGTQSFVKEAPLHLLYIADISDTKDRMYEALLLGADVGFISENVYLFCASEGLATVVLGWVNHIPLSKALNLPTRKKVILAQAVGYK
jgi:nitroreductase